MCAKCSTVNYCSRKCQKHDWKQHKKVCGKGTEASTSQQGPSASASTSANNNTNIPAVYPIEYYNSQAHKVPAAKALATSINLSLPPRRGGLSIPIRRLVLTGKDTPENLELLLGPIWKSQEKYWGEARIEILLDPPHGSPAWALGKGLDDGTPAPTPRTANSEESTKIQVWL
jgi:hypothetical protein